MLINFSQRKKKKNLDTFILFLIKQANMFEICMHILCIIVKHACVTRYCFEAQSLVILLSLKYIL